MNDEDRIDFGALDPAQDPERWSQLIRQVTIRALERRWRTATISGQLSAWAQPVLAVAAALSLTIWAGALLGHGPQSNDAVDLLSQWAVNDEVPATAHVFETFGVGHGSR